MVSGRWPLFYRHKVFDDMTGSYCALYRLGSLFYCLGVAWKFPQILTDAAVGVEAKRCIDARGVAGADRPGEMVETKGRHRFLAAQFGWKDTVVVTGQWGW